jgi:membrane protein implicated in regulation of membrane protease activity
MKKALPFLIAGGLLALLIVGGFFLYHWDGLQQLRDMAIVFLAGLFVVAVLLLAAMVGIFAYVSLLMKDKLIPVLEELTRTAGELTQTAQRVKGTTEFVSEQVATPIIGFAKNLARMRAMAKAATNRNGETEPPI